MELSIVGQKTNAIFDPARLWRKIGKEKKVGENISHFMGGLVDFSLETPLSLLEHLVYRMPVSVINQSKLNKPDEKGVLDIPDRFETENLLSVVRSESKQEKKNWIVLRQTFFDQYSTEYSLHRLDFNLTPMLNNRHSDYRIMDMNIFCRINPPIQTTDVYPQTKWEKEGVKIGDKIWLDASGKYKPAFNVRIPRSIGNAAISAKPLTTNTVVELGRHYFQEINYETEVPVIEGRALSNGFGWRFFGNYESFVECGTKRLTAILLVPNKIFKAMVDVSVDIGITKRDRRDPVYPPTKNLSYGSILPCKIPLYLSHFDDGREKHKKNVKEISAC